MSYSNFYKIIKYRKFLKKKFQNKILIKNKKKYSLICDFNNFNGLGLKLLKLFLNKNNFKFKIYQNLFPKLFNNLTIINSKLIYFKFNKFNNIIKFIKFLKNLTIIPFFCFPLLILNQFKNIILPVNILNFNNLYQLNKKFLIKSIFINLIKNLLFNYLIKIIYKLKKCQH
jgi:hypothetical protein